MAACICGIQVRDIRIILYITIFHQAVIALVHLKECRLQKYSVVTAASGDEVVFVSDPYSPEKLFISRIFLMFDSTGRYRSVARYYVYDFGSVKIKYTAPSVSVEVHLAETRELPGIDIRNTTITMLNVSEADSGVYTLYDDYVGQTLNCWTLYVLSEAKYNNSLNFFEEGTLLNVTDFSHLSKEVVQRLNVSTSWQIEDQVITQLSGYTVNITRSMNNKSLTYIIEGQSHNATSVSYILNVSYTGPIVFEPNRTSYSVPPDSTLLPITCDAVCNPICNITWERRNGTVSETNILRPRGVFDRTTEFICQATNTLTGKKLDESIFLYLAEEKRLTTDKQGGESPTLVYVFAVLMAVFVLTTAASTVCLCRQNICSFNKAWFLRQASNTDMIEMVADNVDARATDDIADRPSSTYEDLQSRNGQEEMYDGICNQKQPSEDRNNTYENVL